jgi:hypothetical protein
VRATRSRRVEMACIRAVEHHRHGRAVVGPRVALSSSVRYQQLQRVAHTVGAMATLRSSVNAVVASSATSTVKQPRPAVRGPSGRLFKALALYICLSSTRFQGVVPASGLVSRPQCVRSGFNGCVQTVGHFVQVLVEQVGASKSDQPRQAMRNNGIEHDSIV